MACFVHSVTFWFRLILAAVLCLNWALVRPSADGFRATHWEAATATWYGSVDGAGTDGGACGYGCLTNTSYGSTVAAGSPVLFRNGKGCGACYQVRCVDNSACSGAPVTITITDECPGGYCSGGATHFDLSGKAFSKMATFGKTAALLNAGVVPVLFRRTQCTYHGRKIEFQIGEGATNYWLEVLIMYEDGKGDLLAVELMQEGSSMWQGMQQVWGAYWCLNDGPLHGPFSIRLTSSSGRTLTAYNVIPFDWRPGQTYNSDVNF